MSVTSSLPPRSRLLPQPRRAYLAVGAGILILLVAYFGGFVTPDPLARLEIQPVTKGDVEETVTALGKP